MTRIPYSGQELCREHFLRFFGERAKRELARQGKLPKGTLAVALSGGKDSVSLLHFLYTMSRDRPDVELVAVSVDEGISGYRESALRICEQVTAGLGVAWRVVRTEDLAGYSIDAYARGERGPRGARGEDAAGTPRPACGPCGVFRRVGINRLAKEVGAAGVATGHNLDDHAQTVLMNFLEGDVDRVGRLAPHTTRRDGMVPRLVPFRTIPEREVLLYALLHGLPVHDEAECPYAERARRFRLRDMLLDLEAQSPGTRHSLLRSEERVKGLLGQQGSAPARECRHCGEPTSGDVCKACQWSALVLS